MSHVWDGSLWDLRPPSDANALWLDSLALHQVSLLPIKLAALPFMEERLSFLGEAPPCMVAMLLFV